MLLRFTHTLFIFTHTHQWSSVSYSIPCGTAQQLVRGGCCFCGWCIGSLSWLPPCPLSEGGPLNSLNEDHFTTELGGLFVSPWGTVWVSSFVCWVTLHFHRCLDYWTLTALGLPSCGHLGAWSLLWLMLQRPLALWRQGLLWSSLQTCLWVVGTGLPRVEVSVLHHDGEFKGTSLPVLSLRALYGKGDQARVYIFPSHSSEWGCLQTSVQTWKFVCAVTCLMSKIYIQ